MFVIITGRVIPILKGQYSGFIDKARFNIRIIGTITARYRERLSLINMIINGQVHTRYLGASHVSEIHLEFDDRD